MKIWAKTRLFVLVLVLGILGHMGYTRGFGWQLGGGPAAIEGLYTTEEAWIVGEIVRDIAEMASFPAGTPLEVTVAPVEGQASRYRVSPGSAPAIEFDLTQDLWSPQVYANVARALLGSAASTSGARPPVYDRFLDLTPVVLVDASTAISADLGRDMRSPAAHEAAAITIGAFALRESSARFFDVRWSLNRITAHLAMAAALRGDSPQTIEGRVAEAALLVLANHQARALSALDALDEQPADAVAAWTRALRLRVTQDWRALASPATATRLEKLEYYRARRATVSQRLAHEELAGLNVEPAIDFVRIAEASSLHVEDGGLMDDTLESEHSESADVFRRIHQREMASEGGQPLNSRAGRSVHEGTVDILPWGAWAEFSQRHLAMYVGRIDSFIRFALGGREQADALKATHQDVLGDLFMFPMATIFWTTGPAGGDADLRHINEAIASAVSAPERVPPTVWAFLEMGARYEAVRKGMPPKVGWFVPLTARAPYEAGTRMKELWPSMQPNVVEALKSTAPFDFTLASEALRLAHGEKPPYEQVEQAFTLRLDYDLRALKRARESTNVSDQRVRLLRASCAIATIECTALGNELVRQNQPEAAAAEYERVFGDPQVDSVELAQNAGWLVNYYADSGRTAAALALAERAGSTGAYAGLITQAAVYERLQRFDEAEDLYRKADSRYTESAELIGFYYRAVNVRQQDATKAALDEQLRRVFPDGLVDVAPANGTPTTGVIVTKDSELSRAAGLQAGDIIVGLEGRRVQNLHQYQAINAFSRDPRMTITAWRGRNFEVTLTAPNRRMGIEFRSHPIRGWAED